MSAILLQVTLGTGATRLTSTVTPAFDIQFQNNATHTMRVGDSTVTSSRGILLPAGPAGGTLYLGPYRAYNINIADFWAVGTQGDVLDVIYTQ